MAGRPAREQVVKLRGDRDADAYAGTGMQYRQAARVARSPERHVMKLLPRVVAWRFPRLGGCVVACMIMIPVVEAAGRDFWTKYSNSLEEDFVISVKQLMEMG
jgi:hypothetical protein